MNKKPIILCIDDEQVILQSLKSQLKDYLGTTYILEAAETGNIALEIIDELLAEGREIPLVLVDYLMPGMRGDQVLIDIHDRSPMTICIMLTGQADLSAVANAINHEALFRFMSKPWNKEDLLKTISEAFHRHSLEKSLIEKQKLLEEQNTRLAELNNVLIKKNETFYKFVPAEFLNTLDIDVNGGHIALGRSCQKEVAVLFTDIRSFTDITQNFTNTQTFDFVNSFTALISPIITGNHGFIDKFIGDAVLSIYENVSDCLETVLAAIKAIENLPKNSPLYHLKVGFAMNYGSVQMGTVGYSGRMETTILGKVVNIAARIEKLNKKYDTVLILTEDAWKLADKEKYKFVMLEETYIQGIKEPIKLYTIETGSVPKVGEV